MTKTPDQLKAENKELRRQLSEANEALEAIRHGDVDAILIEHPEGPQVYTLTGADQPYRIMVEEMQEGAVTLRDDAVIMYGNKQVARMLATSHQELIGACFHDFLAPDSRSFFDSLWQGSRHRPSRGEVSLITAQGTQVETLLALNLLTVDGFVQTSVVVTDLTEHKRHQATLASEAYARERAQQLAEESRRKDEFLAMLAHELRNPLAPIHTGIDILQMVPPEGEQMKQILHMMDEQVHNLVRLIDDLLDVSRITRGKLVLKRQPVELSKIIANALEIAQPLVHEKAHELTVKQARKSVYLHGDPTRLTQIVANLLNNAAKYTHPGGLISLTTARSGDEVVIRIKDNGIGISPEILPRIYEMFVQADNSLSRSHGGLGIGLTLVKSLVEMHGGTIEADSEGLGKGSEFTVRLPILPVGDVAAAESADSSETQKTFPRHRILIVDDLLPIAFMLSTLLQSWGQDVATAGNGIDALAMIEQEKPDLVLSDISMPEMSGYELAQAIRQRQEWNDIYLVAVTGYGQEGDKTLAREAGFNGHVVKPISKADLERLLVSCPYRI